MEKSKAIEELIRVLLGDIDFEDCGDRVYVEIRGVPCIMRYKEKLKNVDALKVPSLRKEAKEEGVYGKTLGETVESYKSMLKKLRKAGYKIKKHDFFGPHLLRVVT